MVSVDDAQAIAAFIRQRPALAEVLAELLKAYQECASGTVTAAFRDGTMTHYKIERTHKASN